ncbi:MAG: PorT family protein [Chitinophagales bacterium]|nr:PorT family protein [Chitinophagales bacterium]
MKSVLLTAWMFLLLPAVGFSQQVWTPEQQQQFQQEMEQWKVQFQQQMLQLQDQLAKMKEELKDQNRDSGSDFDIQFEVPPMPPMPPGSTGDQNEEDTTSFLMPDMDNENNDSTEVKVGRWNIIVRDNHNKDEQHVNIYKDKTDCTDNEESHHLKNIETKYLLLDVGLNNYSGRNGVSNLTANYSPLKVNTGKSWVVDVHLINQKINLISYHLWLSYGIFFEFNSYKFNDLTNVLVPRVDSVVFVSSEQPLKKNKLSPTYVGIPVMLRLETNPDDINKSFHISAGGFGEYLLGAHTKTKTTSGDKNKQHDDFNLNDFRYGITGRIGYGWFNLYTNVSLSTLFAKDVAPEAYPWSVGLAFEF